MSITNDNTEATEVSFSSQNQKLIYLWYIKRDFPRLIEFQRTSKIHVFLSFNVTFSKPSKQAAAFTVSVFSKSGC